MKAFGLRWWISAFGLTLLLVTLELSSVAFNAPLEPSPAADARGSLAPSPATGDERHEATSAERGPSSSAPATTR